MADFLPPFADSGERRLPTSTEQSNGIPCGPLDRTLFNGIFNLHNGNIGRVIQEAGITGPDGDLTKLFRAIQALIESATGTSSGGDTSQFVLFSQARARLPIFPDVLNTDGRIVCTSPGTGQVRVPGGVDFLHRGIWLVTTIQTDIATDPSKTYHLRWNPTDGIVLRDLASGTYNPSTLPEADQSFDSTFDDMLIARVVTNSSNVPTITNLANKDRLSLPGETALTQNNPYENDKRPSQIIGGDNLALNLARRPRAAIGAITDLDGSVSAGTLELNIGIVVDSRYRARTFYQYSVAEPRAAAFSYEVWL